MNDTCKQCGGKCCKTLLIDCPNPYMRDFIATTRGTMLGQNTIMVKCQCRHLAEDGTCRIYDDRPDSCRNYTVDGITCKLTQANGRKVGI
jgi:Fe-S-cluster containining protein